MIERACGAGRPEGERSRGFAGEELPTLCFWGRREGVGSHFDHFGTLPLSFAHCIVVGCFWRAPALRKQNDRV